MCPSLQLNLMSIVIVLQIQEVKHGRREMFTHFYSVTETDCSYIYVVIK